MDSYDENASVTRQKVYGFNLFCFFRFLYGFSFVNNDCVLRKLLRSFHSMIRGTILQWLYVGF